MQFLFIVKFSSTMLSELIFFKFIPCAKAVILWIVFVCFLYFFYFIFITIHIIMLFNQWIVFLHLWIAHRHQLYEFFAMENISKDISNLCLSACCNCFCKSVIIFVVKNTQVLKYLIFVFIYNRVCRT